MKSSTIIKLLFILLFSSFSASIAEAKTIRVFGSDLFETWLPEYYESTELSEDLSISFSLSGSYGALIALQNNYADSAIYLQAESTAVEIPEGFTKTELGYLVIYLYAPISYPGSEISKEMLSKIANTSESDTTITWEALLPNSGSWAQQSTRVLVDTGENEILWSLYRLAFIQSDSISERITLTGAPETLINTLNENDYFILATGHSEAPSDSLKPLALTDFDESVAFPATPENIIYGDYSARFPIYLIYPENASWSQNLLHVFQSQDFEELLIEHNILPKI